MKIDDIQVGDIVRVREWDDMAAEFGVVGSHINCCLTFITEMREFCGNEYVVEDIEYGIERVYFELTPDSEERGYSFSADMLELVEESGTESKIELSDWETILNCC